MKLAIPILIALSIFTLGCDSEKPSEEKVTWGRADAKEINLTSKIPGRVVKLNVAEGDRVSRGEIIAQIDQRDLLAQKSQIEAKCLEQQAAFEIAKSSLDLARADLNRYEMLMNENAIARQTFEQYQTRYDVAVSTCELAESAISQAKASLEQLEVSLDETEIRIPFDGIITEKFVEEGSMISQGTPLVAIQDPRDNWIDLKIPETDLKNFYLDQTLELLARDGETRIEGTVVDISRKAEFATQRATSERGSDSDIITFNVKIQTDNEFVRPGMRFKLVGEV